MNVLDYRDSYVISVAAQDGVEMNTCRAQVLASCALTDVNDDETYEFYLGKECIGEYMYKEDGIAQVPTSEVGTVCSRGDSSMWKKFANHDHDVIQSGPWDVRRKTFAGGYAYWTDLQFILKSAEARPLRTSEDITASIMAGEAMIGRTELRDAELGWKATLEYPVSYVNVHPPAGNFQVDVGPILFPDFASTEDLIVDRIQLAYVLYNQLDEVEFAIREPTVVADGQSAQTLHYSKVVKTAARSELFSLTVGDV